MPDTDSEAYIKRKIPELRSIASDYTLAIEPMSPNCRNISDEVFPGLFLGDK